MSTPPSSWSCIAYVEGTANTNPRATNLNATDAHFDILASAISLVRGLYSLTMFLARRFAWAIAIIAAGTSPPTNIPRRHSPASHPGKTVIISEGTTYIPCDPAGNWPRKVMADGTEETSTPISAKNARPTPYRGSNEVLTLSLWALSALSTPLIA